MAKPQSSDEKLARYLIESDLDMARRVAKMREPGYGMDPVSQAKELELWDLRAEGADEQALYAQGKGPREVLDAVYPYRSRLMRSGGRLKRSEQVEYAERMQRRSEEAAQRRAGGELAYPEPEDTAGPALKAPAEVEY